MNFDKIDAKKKLYQEIKIHLTKMEEENADIAFAIEFTHDSTAIEGNTLTLSETKVLLEDGILPSGGKELREIYEVINHAKAFDFIKERVQLKLPPDEACLKEIHKIVTDRILDPFAQGEYRHHNVRIAGSMTIPARYEKLGREMSRFFQELQQKANETHPIEKAAWAHAELVKIHPFADGNGRASRLLLNYELLQNGFPAVTINKKDRNNYIAALEQYSTEGDLKPFVKMIKNEVKKQLDFHLSHFKNHLKTVKKSTQSKDINQPVQ